MNGFAKKKINSHLKNWPLLLKSLEKQSKISLAPNYCNLYAYAANNPLHYIDPDGNSLEDADDGKKIHDRISREYIDQHPGDKVYANNAISTTLFDLGMVDKGLGKTDLGLRPDIWNVTTGDMYEIKPAEQGAGTAKNQLVTYLILAHKCGVSDVHTGKSDEPGTRGSFMLDNKLVTYWSPADGVILYTKVPSKSPSEEFNYNVEFKPNPFVMAATVIFFIIFAPSGLFS